MNTMIKIYLMRIVIPEILAGDSFQKSIDSPRWGFTQCATAYRTGSQDPKKATVVQCTVPDTMALRSLTKSSHEALIFAKFS